MVLFIKILITVFCVYAAGRLFLLAWQERLHTKPLALMEKIKLGITGFVANVADTVGMGSFAVIVAFDKYWNLMEDEKLPGTLNAHSVLPGLCQSLFFLQAVPVEITTLLSLIVAASVGGFFGGFFVSKLDKDRLRFLMFLGYAGIAILIIANKLGLLPIGGELMSLHGIWLVAGIVGMLLTGTLPAIGVGSYAPTLVILFLLGMSPLAAFPIMTASGAILQSTAALVFIARKQVAIKASLILSLTGVLGVLVAAPMITYINSDSLRWLLLAIVLYNVHRLWTSSVRRAVPA